jgi:hypothetical protein
MDAVDLEGATATLYALPPADFTARRGALVAQARQAGDPALAQAVSTLRRPTVAAWLVNQLVRAEHGGSGDLEQLAALGEQLREAQGALHGPRIRELTRRRHDLVAALVRRARELASAGGQQVGASVQRELEETFGAAIADEQASLAVTSGRLTRALAYAGLGEVDLTAATATPLSPRRRPPPSAGTKARPERAGAGRRQQAGTPERRSAARAVEQAGADLAAAEDEVAASEDRRDRARADHARASDHLEELRRELAEARRELAAAAKAASAAEREHQRLDQDAREARKRLRRAEEALARLDPG